MRQLVQDKPKLKTEPLITTAHLNKLPGNLHQGRSRCSCAGARTALILAIVLEAMAPETVQLASR
jgi:hypothetical protein